MPKLLQWMRSANRQRSLPVEDSPFRAFLVQLPIAWFWQMAWLAAGLGVLTLEIVGATSSQPGRTGWHADLVILGLFVGLVSAWLLRVTHPNRWAYRWPALLIPLVALVTASIFIAVPNPVAAGCLVVASIPYFGYLAYILPPYGGRVVTFCVPVAVGLGALLPAEPLVGRGSGSLILVLGMAAGGALLIQGSRWIWRESHQIGAACWHAQVLDRRRAFATFDSILHDGALVLLERVAAGQNIDAAGRREAAEMAATARRRFLGDDRPRMVAQLIDDAAAKAAGLGIVLVRVAYLEAEPPQYVLEAFADALGALVANLTHAKVESARISVDSDGSSLTVSLVDDGVGRAPEVPWGPSVRRRVFQRLEQIGATAEVESEVHVGTIWRLQWRQS